jgi:hypothetical protein
MYTLRKVIDNIQSNQALGNEYHFIDRESNYDEFSRTYLIHYDKGHVADLDKTADNFSTNCYAFIVNNGFSNIIPLYKEQQNYIMTENGKTFSNLTYK